MRPGRSPFRSLTAEFRSAWRGVRARGWRAGLIVALLAVSLGASAVVFSAADSFVFGRVPYPDAPRLVVLQRTTTFSGTSDYLPPDLIPEWRKHTDLFSAVHAHDRGPSLYLTTGDMTESVRAQLVTPGLFEALGVAPRWGRSLQPGDEQPDQPPVAVIGEELARRIFGEPARAVGQSLQSGNESFQIVGVMPRAFRFPTTRERIWRPFDLARRQPNIGVRGLFQIAPDVEPETVARAVADRAPLVARAATRPIRRDRAPVAVPLVAAQADARATVVFAMLMGAAVCVLLIACANVASLELAGAIARRRIYAIHAALGARRAMLVRTGLIEGAVLIGGSGVLAWLLARWGVGTLAQSLPPTMSDPLANPIDLDPRALAFMAAAAAATWLLTTVPVVLRATRSDLFDLLKRDDRTLRLSAGGALRQILMVGQVALTVMLLVGALLTVRTYAARVALEKGFDSTGVAAIQVSQTARSAVKAAELEEAILSRLQQQPGVRSVSRTDSIPPSTVGGIGNRLSIEGQPTTTESIKLSGYTVDPEYFTTMGIRILAGRIFTAADPPGYLVVDERFARRYWPGGDALGARFNMGGGGMSGATEFEIIGIAAPVRMESTETPGGDELFVVYNRITPTYSPLSFVVRLEHERQLGALASLVRSMAPGRIVRADLVETRYRRLYGDVRLAVSVTSGFGVLAYVVAMAGVYGVMMFLVTGRTREIGVRIALGAQPSDIRRMFLGASARFVAAGALLGVVGATLMSRAMSAMLFGVTPSDPTTFGTALVLVGATALVATWFPARQAARVDPVVALRAE